jgi:hypothetical protein
LVHATDRAADGRRFEAHGRRAETYRNFAEVPYCYLGTLFFGDLRVGRTLGFTPHILPVSGRATVGSICFYVAGGDLVRGFAFIADNVFARIARLRRSGARFPPGPINASQARGTSKMSKSRITRTARILLTTYTPRPGSCPPCIGSLPLPLPPSRYWSTWCFFAFLVYSVTHFGKDLVMVRYGVLKVALNFIRGHAAKRTKAPYWT